MEVQFADGGVCLVANATPDVLVPVDITMVLIPPNSALRVLRVTLCLLLDGC